MTLIDTVTTSWWNNHKTKT